MKKTFEDHWEDYHFRRKCGLNSPEFCREKKFNIEEVKEIALHSYNAGLEEASNEQLQPTEKPGG